MATRAADATIKGYYYQFDTSILKLLDLKSDTDSIVIEGIEDIDIESASETTTVQCKYLSKPRFINSAVREPISLMLDHFTNPSTPNDLKYVLYTHFENETAGNEPDIDLTKLKDILTYSENKVEKHYEIEKGITDDQLKVFLSQFKLIFGTEFYTQQSQILQKFRTTFSCSEFEADTHFYNNALRVVVDKAIKKDINDRKITRLDFFTAIDVRKKLFNEWFIAIRNKKEYLKQSSQSLKSLRALEPSRSKIILVGNNLVSADNTQLPLAAFIENATAKFYKPNSSMRNAKPLTFIIDADKAILHNLKKELIQREVIFNDGYEELEFSSTIFNIEPIINTSKNGAKISKASYLVKLISKETFMTNISGINSPSIFICFSDEDFPTRFSSGQFFEFKYCENLQDAFKIIAS
ncbi:DUF4297 family anti-phage-associated protein [Flavobacterium sp.]|uniref:DUF4297 family anti-phage-associated protein n=1 Tax=Flavobacterium sp. TaxID=239 RepID=UPI0039E4ABC4